ncbi:MAG: fatty acyl-AMP ligase, partial [Acidobacteriota bacterium]
MNEKSYLGNAPSTLIEILSWRADEQPKEPVYTFLADKDLAQTYLTYFELNSKARAIAAALQACKAQGERALLLYPPGLEFIVAFFACLYSGVVAVPVYPPDPMRLNRTLNRFLAIANDAQPMVGLTTSTILPLIEYSLQEITELKNIQWFATDKISTEMAAEWQSVNIKKDTLAFLQYTSGSTSSPKGVMLTHENLLHNSTLIHQFFQTDSNSKGVIWLPTYHDMGLIGGILQPLYKGFPVTLMSPITFLQRPLRWLQAISRTQATISGGPNFAYDLCVRKISEEEKASLDLSSWRLAFNGAEPIRSETMARFSQAFAVCGFRAEAFYPCYGLAEATLIVSGGSKTATPIINKIDGALFEYHKVITTDKHEAITVVGCGRCDQSQRILIVDTETLTVCLPDRVGEIWVSGPSVAQGYWQKPLENDKVFNAFTDNGEGPFLRTGDLGFIKDGELFVTGRLKDLIIIRGRNYYPQDIEWTIEQNQSSV